MSVVVVSAILPSDIGGPGADAADLLPELVSPRPVVDVATQSHDPFGEHEAGIERPSPRIARR